MTHADAVAEEAPPSSDQQPLHGRRHTVELVRTLSHGVMIYGLILWIYVAICGIVVPETLALPLTHLLPFLRKDTSGFLAFAASFIGFVVYRTIDRRQRLYARAGRTDVANEQQ